MSVCFYFKTINFFRVLPLFCVLRVLIFASFLLFLQNRPLPEAIYGSQNLKLEL